MFSIGLIILLCRDIGAIILCVWSQGPRPAKYAMQLIYLVAFPFLFASLSVLTIYGYAFQPGIKQRYHNAS